MSSKIQSQKRLNVIQLLPALEVGGVERGTLDVAKELVRRGHCSIIISAGGSLVDELVSCGSKHIRLDIGKKSLLSLRHIAHLRRYFSEESIDIIHACSRFPGWLAYLAWNRMDKAHRPRFITTVHGAYSVNAYSKIMTKGQDVIAVSDFIVKYIAKNYPDVDKNKITLIHRGVSKTEFPFAYKANKSWLESWRAQHSTLSNKFILALPGRISRRKGHEDFLGILNYLKQQNIPVHGLVIGGAHKQKKSYLNELKNKAQKLGIEKEITFLGNRNDVKEIMSISDVALSLSKVPEAFGLTALEALCLGTPVVAYDHGGAAEVLAKMYPQGRVEPNDIGAVCDRIISFYKEPIAVVDKNFFTLDKMLEDTLSLYCRE